MILTAPVQRILRTIERTSLGFRALNALPQLNRTFASFDQAWLAARRNEILAHDNQQLVKINLGLSSDTRPSDYPALYWLSQIPIDGMSVFDYGGGAGQLFYQYSRLLRSGAVREWIAMDLPEVVPIGIKFAEQRRAQGLRFSTSLADSARCDVFLASGALHYWERTMRDLADEAGGLPDHFIINRSPFRASGAPFVSIQHGPGWAVPFVARNADAIEREFKELGYQLVDRWKVLEKTFDLALLPRHKTPYMGFYFRRA